MAMIGHGIGARPEMLKAIDAHPRARPAHRRAHEQLAERRRQRLAAGFAFARPSSTSWSNRRSRECASPIPRIYELTCERLGVEPADTVFLDDIGANLKPARAMGITTIKVDDPAQALRDLEAVLGFGFGD